MQSSSGRNTQITTTTASPQLKPKPPQHISAVFSGVRGLKPSPRDLVISGSKTGFAATLADTPARPLCAHNGIRKPDED